MYFDTHAHYDDEAFDADREELIASLPQRGVGLVVNPGCDRASSEAAVGFARRFEHFYAAVGWHPQAADEMADDGEEFLTSLAGEDKVVAIGEIGLDYHYETPERNIQKRCLERQLALAVRLDLPVIIHDREAHGDCLELIRAFPGLRGVFHCYSGSAEMAAELIRMGWYLSFTGAITFKNARKALETIAMMPEDRIMLETDAPYLAPVPMRGKRCDSTLLPYIAQKIAEIRGWSLEQTRDITAENGRRFFGINP